MSLDHERGPRSWRPGAAWAAAAAYAALTVALTWPLTPGLTRDLPSDLADPLLNSWIVAWGADHILRFASGEWGAFSGYWNANIFYPAPLTLAYSEHLFAQALQAAPVYAATRNVILCYNLLFLSTFVISGLGVFLLLRDLTRDSGAAFAGGLFFAFTPYRFEHMPHLQVMSFQWMPFVLLGLRRFVSSGRPLPLAMAGVALVMHNLSCGYYMLFFAPFVVAWAVFEMHARGRIGSARHWAGLVLCAAAVLAATLPFLLPYAELRRQEPTLRRPAEVEAFSADLAAWMTATPHLRLWARFLPGLDRPEGHLFPGAVPLLLAVLGTVGATRGVGRAQGPARPWRIRIAAGAASPKGFSAVACLATVWLSLGPVPRLWGQGLHLPGLYASLYAFVPGFDGLRAPSRYAAVAVLFLCLLAGLALARARGLRFGALVAPLAGVVFVLESLCVPIPLNGSWRSEGLSAPPPPGRQPEPAVYSAVRALPADAVLVELPFDETVWETRAMYYSTHHWRRLVNGYSGHFPHHHYAVRARLRRAVQAPDDAWAAIRSSGATHVIVHTWAWNRVRVGQRIASQLEERGAGRLGEFDGDVLLELPGGS